MADSIHTIQVIENLVSKQKPQKILGKHAYVQQLFQTLHEQIKLPCSFALFCTADGLILNVLQENSADSKNSGIHPGLRLPLDFLPAACPDTIYYDTVSGYVLITLTAPEEETGVKAFLSKICTYMQIFDDYVKENRQLWDSLDAVKKSISIYDKDATLLYANQYFCNYLHIANREQVIGRSIEDVIKSAGTKVHSIDTNTNRLKMHDVLHKGEEVIDWEVRILSSKGDTQIAGNDMYPVLDENGTVTGMVEITHSRQQSLDSAKKLVGLSAEYTFENIIGTSTPMRESIRTAKDYANSPLSLLITGESGVGKELFAQAVHNYSDRRKGPFVALNCASFPENLIESELFGYVGGAFTGASKNGQIGKFELADGGTLFLDEVGELPFHFQSKLLRVLETWTITRIGSTKPFPVNVRLIAATNRNLEKMVEEGLFRQDLYYRLQILNIIIPPLRSRREDILQISEELLRQGRAPGSLQEKTLTEDAKQILLSYDWPGNVRELRNVLSRAALLSKSSFITRDVLTASIFASGSDARLSYDQNLPDSTLSAEARLAQRQQEVEAAGANLLKEAISIAGGNKSKAAALLDMSRNTFYRMLKKYNLE